MANRKRLLRHSYELSGRVGFLVKCHNVIEKKNRSKQVQKFVTLRTITEVTSLVFLLKKNPLV